MSIRFSRFLGRAVSLFAAALVLVSAASALISEQVIFNFTGKSGMTPNSRLIQDSSGRFYGTTIYGGQPGPNCLSIYGCGVVFELAPKSGGGWNYRRLHAFTGGVDGGIPGTSLLLDGAGNLYGVATSGGTYAGGLVFKLSRGAGGAWTETVIYAFNPANTADGDSPTDGLIVDSAGNLYGNTGVGGPHENGTVFKLAPNSDGSWSESVLYDFTAPSDGCAVAGGVVFDKSGNLFGTTKGCGTFGMGNVFELSSDSSGGWTESVLYSFSGCCPDNPSGPLIIDSAGNLYGTGPNPDNGYIYQLAKGSNGSWTENIIYAFFDLQQGAEPAGGLVADKNGNLYGTTAQGGEQFGNGNGLVFKLTPHSNGTWSETIVYAFAGGTDATEPTAGVTFGKGGALYGTTLYGGSAGDGAVFKITP
jgi:uncharacterized repeat protein (TIGR03803 family)